MGSSLRKGGIASAHLVANSSQDGATRFVLVFCGVAVSIGNSIAVRCLDRSYRTLVSATWRIDFSAAKRTLVIGGLGSRRAGQPHIHQRQAGWQHDESQRMAQADCRT